MPIVNAADLDSLSDHPELERYDKEPMGEGYVEFRESEGIPVHRELYVEDIYDLEVGPWDRTGQRGALVNLFGMEGQVDLQLHELAPGGETTRQRHLYQEIVYVLQGEGVTRVGTGEAETTFEWQAGSLFVLPKNVPYKHANLSEDTPAKLAAQTDLPTVVELLGDSEYVFECEDEFGPHFEGGDTYGEGEPGMLHFESGSVTAWLANYVPDIAAFDEVTKDDWDALGEMDIVRLAFPGLNLDVSAHLSEIPVGTYKNPHRHLPGALIYILSGEGYALMWMPDSEAKVRVDWGPGSVYCPPGGWFHHHFNVGRDPANQFAIHPTEVGTMGENGGGLDPHIPDNIIEYDAEDPEIRDLFEAELAERGIESRMADEA